MGCEVDAQTIVEMQKRIEDPKTPRKNRRILELMLKHLPEEGEKSNNSGRIRFFRRPRRILLDQETRRIRGLEVETTADDGTTETLDCSLLIYAIGFQSAHLPGVPVDEQGQLRLLDDCRVEEQRAAVYATGWCAKVRTFCSVCEPIGYLLALGPSVRPQTRILISSDPRKPFPVFDITSFSPVQAGGGVIADTQRSSVLVAEAICKDLQEGRVQLKADEDKYDAKKLVDERLRHSATRYLTWADWKRIDAEEKRLGAAVGKPREKIHDVVGYLDSLN